MVTNYIPRNWDPDYVPPRDRSKFTLDNRYKSKVIDSDNGVVRPAHGPKAPPSALAFHFRHQRTQFTCIRCDVSCCTNADFLDLFKFAAAMGCSVLTRVLPSQGGLACVHNTILVPWEQVPQFRKMRGRLLRGKHTGWAYHALRGKAGTPNGYDYKLPIDTVDYHLAKMGIARTPIGDKPDADGYYPEPAKRAHRKARRDAVAFDGDEFLKD